MNALELLAPYQWQPAFSLGCLFAAAVFLRGVLRLRTRGERGIGWGRATAFLVGVGLIYVVTQTRFDYFAQFMFFIHRGQHMVLHHLAPLLIAAAAPAAVMAAGVPEGVRAWLARAAAMPVLRAIYGVLQHPVVAPVLFVGLIYLWLTPEIHFDAMLSPWLYEVMNLSMAIDGLLFWWLILDRHGPGESPFAIGYGTRILLLVLVVPPQIVLGAVIALSPDVLYDVYAVCGRAFPIAPHTDQQLGGLLTWIPTAMMSLLGVILVLARLRHSSRESGMDSRVQTGGSLAS